MSIKPQIKFIFLERIISLAKKWKTTVSIASIIFKFQELVFTFLIYRRYNIGQLNGRNLKLQYVSQIKDIIVFHN